MKKIMLVSAFAAVSGLMAADGAALYQKCVACHGAKGEKKALNKSEIITGWDKEKTIKVMKGYKDGTYGKAMKAMMKGQVTNLTDSEIEALADYIAKMK